MTIQISPSIVQGTISAPPSKSMTHRMLILAALTDGTSRVKNVLLSDDILHTKTALQSMGVAIKQTGKDMVITGTGGKLSAPENTIDVGASGTSLRLLTAITALTEGKTTITGEKRLQERPIGELVKALSTLGITIVADKNNQFLPVTITGGKIKGGSIMLSGAISSQFVSGLLLIAPFADDDIVLTVQKLKSKPYVDMTIAAMQEFGVTAINQNYERFSIAHDQKYQAKDIMIEGDYSSSSYFLAAAAITNGTVTVSNLNPSSKQADRRIVSILKQMGTRIEQREQIVTVKGADNLHGITIDMSDAPDIVQTVAVVAACANGVTEITNIEHIRYKETDRITDTANELRKMGIAVTEKQDGLLITGGKPTGNIIDTHHDHRMAMSFAVLGLVAKGSTTITHAEVVSKSYPDFFTDLKNLGATITEGETL